jgi:hypothetical protein
MSQHNKHKIDVNVMFGYDAPCDGYFCTLFDLTESDEYGDNPILDEIGFEKGVTLDELLEFADSYQLKFTDDEIRQLKLDKINARPLTDLQRSVNAMFDFINGTDNT